MEPEKVLGTTQTEVTEEKQGLVGSPGKAAMPTSPAQLQRSQRRQEADRGCSRLGAWEGMLMDTGSLYETGHTSLRTVCFVLLFAWFDLFLRQGLSM